MYKSSSLLNYLIVVGPSTQIPESAISPCIPPDLDVASPSPSSTHGEGEWDSIFKPRPAILRRFPEQDNPICSLTSNIVYFCQPEGCIKEKKQEASHIFMLTNTETNVRTYGVCISFPHLIDPLARAQSRDWQYENQDSVSIQEWGLLSVCILSQYQCFRFFQRCLKTLIRFIDNYCGSKLTWDLLIHSKFAPDDDPNYTAVREVENWITNLLQLPPPTDGLEVLEVELEVDPAVLIGFPPISRLPLFDLAIHEMFEVLDINLVIEIYKLLLLEQKVILHSEDQGIASQCILTMVSLLYPLQYLFPIIPLLPTCLPNVENLLFVPTPYFIGVCTSFLDKVSSFHCAEAWIIDLDKKTITEPTQFSNSDFSKFPLSLHSLQADLRRCLDKLNPSCSPRSSDLSAATTYSCSEGVVSLEDDVDVQIRLSFADFLLGKEMLGLVENHLSIYRLFPRPVVSLKYSSFIKAYSNVSSGAVQFMKTFIKSQSVEYYLEWSLNPTNKAFEEIKKGYCNVDNVGDKLSWWIQRTRPTRIQYTLYSLDPTSILYQEMLNHKATQSTESFRNTQSLSDDSEFEIIGREYSNGSSDITSSYYSDCIPSPSYVSKSDHTVPVTIEFHPATPIDGSTAIITVDDGSSNETYLALQDDSDVELKEVFSSCRDIQVTPEPSINADFVSASVEEREESSFHTLDTGNSASDIIQLSPPPNDESSSKPLVDNMTATATDNHSPPVILSSTIEPPLPPREPSPFRSGGMFVDPSHPGPLLEPPPGGILRKTVIDLGRSVTPEQRSIPKSSSWMNLTGGSIEMLQFTDTHSTSTPAKGLQNDNTDKEKPVPSSVIRSVPWSAVSSLHELENQIKEIVGRVGDGNGIPWYKPPSLKTISMEERSRIALLRVLEVRLGVRSQTDTKLSADGEIKPVVLSKFVYKGVLELLAYLMQFIEAELIKDIETPVFSLFLILRLALCLCTKAPRKRAQSTRVPSVKEKEKENRLMRSSSLLRSHTVSSKTSNITTSDLGPTPLVDSNQHPPPSLSPTPHDMDSTITGDKMPQEIELEQLARDSSSSSKRPPPLLKAPSKKVIITTPASKEAGDTLTYLHNDLIKELGSNFKELVVKRVFWANMFISVVHTDRKYLGWNEKTSELYDRYNSLSLADRLEFSYKEDTLLSVILHNVLLFLLMMGVSPRDTIDLCHRLSAKTRLASVEEKLLQQTLSELENFEDNDRIDVKDLAVLSLYSETHSVVIFIVHHGVNVTAPIFKLQITDDVCILRRFPDEKITCRFWNDCISNISCNDESMTVSFYYRESLGDYTHHFHSKQFSEIFQCLQVLVSSEQGKLSPQLVN